MQNLSECFSNVHLTAIEYEVDSAGHNMDRSYLECLKLIRKLTNWKYAILLQNYDIPLKTNHEMAAILRALNGSNDVSVSKPFSHRIPRYKDWSYEALHLFKDSNQNDNRTLRIAKGSTAATLSRPFVEFIIDKLNLTILLKRFDSIRYGGDEMLMASLNSDDFLGDSLNKFLFLDHVSYITRYTVWGWSRLPCKSRRYRHGVCVFGVEDLKTLRHSHHLFANKMMPEMDYSAVSCWAKQLRSRTTHRPSAHNHTIDLNFYANLPTVQFNNNRPKWRSNLEAFNCTG
ncbi:unnamed protein product [Anisakis simplex]|uniref:Core-2/I-Branching enzyme n=1 Tax=Anisakis simplex TaxID=6269 RepID=A0A0M3IYY3_ANISI|nr:unnamed protein product [Anisakis simplex]